MSELPVKPLRVSAHQAFIRRSIPEWLQNAPRDRRELLKQTAGSMPDWYKSTSAADHLSLKQAVERSWRSQSRVDSLFEGLADVRKFSAPLLRNAIKNRFGIELDVEETFLRLYLPKGLLTGYEVLTISLLDAALQNFEEKETEPHYYDKASCFISRPDSVGQFEILPSNSALNICDFISLCRQLDVGGQYNRQLEALLLPDDAVAKAVLAHKVMASQQDRFRAATLLAYMKGDICEKSRAMLLRLLIDKKTPMLDGKPLRFYGLSLLGAPMTGIVLFSADLVEANEVVPLIAYVPDDPEHPIKEYASTAAFTDELVRQLRSGAYQLFFARFVDRSAHASFFHTLESVLVATTRHARLPGDTRPVWRSEPVARPNPRLQAQVIRGELWGVLYQRQSDKILNDARFMAVPTADEDRKSRWARWDALQSAAGAGLEVATLVALPFVPLLGELFLAYTVYQVLDEVFTGVLEWSEGQLLEASDHLLAIAETTAQLGAFAVGGAVVGKLFSVPPSAFVESLKIVDTGAGIQRLWLADMGVYERDVRLPAGSQPDELGLHQHRDLTILPLAGKNYAVAAGSDGEFRILHPDRADAYKPLLSHNGSGAWAHEVERPMEWRAAQLFRRLGHSVAEFSDATAERILAVSGLDEAVLRDLHVHSRRPPALLEDSIRRFSVDQQIQTFIEQSSSSDPQVFAKTDRQMHAQVLGALGVSVQEQQLRSPDLLRSVVESLDATTLKTLLNESPAFGDALPGVDVRVVRLGQRLSRWAQKNRSTLFKTLEDQFERAIDQPTRQMRRIFPDLPKSIAQELWRHASAADRLHMQNNRGLSPQMAHEALCYLREVRLTRASEGLYLQTVAHPDTDRLALRMLETLRGWSSDIRIEVHDGYFDGALIDSIGPAEATIRKVLVRQADRYQAFDGSGEELHGLDDLYGAIQHSLPDEQRLALRLPHVGQGAELQQAVRRLPLLPRSDMRVLFQQPPLEPGARSPMRLAVGRPGYLLGGGDFQPQPLRSVDERLAALYPTMTEETRATLRRELLNGDPSLAVARLETEYLALVNDLQIWAGDVPTEHPLTGLPLTEIEVAEQQRGRQLFAQELQDNWSRKVTSATAHTPATLEYDLNIVGELPRLSANFSHVRELNLGSNAVPLNGHSFFASFTGVKYLTLSGFTLKSFPVEIYQMRELLTLTLANCDIQLTEAAVEGLAHIENLTLLDLADNPLKLAPDVSYMQRLDSLYLSNTGLAEVPMGLFACESLAFADLANNQFTRLPDELFEVPDVRAVNYNFRLNPLDETSVQRVDSYLASAGLDSKILIQIDQEVWQEQEPIASEDEDSGVQSSEEDF